MHSHKKHLFGPPLKVQCLFLCSNILIEDIKQTNFKIPQREIHYYKTLLLYNNYCKFIIISSPVDSSLHRADLMPFLIIEQSMIRLLDKNYLDKIKGSWNSWYSNIHSNSHQDDIWFAHSPHIDFPVLSSSDHNTGWWGTHRQARHIGAMSHKFLCKVIRKKVRSVPMLLLLVL